MDTLFGPAPSIVPDDEVLAMIKAALREGGGRVHQALGLADIGAEQIVNRLAAAGVTVVRLPDGPPLT